MTAWMGGKGGLYRSSLIPKAELKLRADILEAEEKDKPALRKILEQMVADRAKHFK